MIDSPGEKVFIKVSSDAGPPVYLFDIEHSPTMAVVEKKGEEKAKDKEGEPYFQPLKILDLYKRTRFQQDTCQICNRTDKQHVIQHFLTTTEDDCPAPLILYCQDRPYCTACAQASEMAYLADRNRLPLPPTHPLYQPHYVKLFRALERELEQWNTEPWKVKRTSGDIESDWLIRFPVWMPKYNQVYLSLQQQSTAKTRNTDFREFAQLNKERLTKLAKSTSLQQWIPRIPDYYPFEKGELFQNAFEHWYYMLTL